MARDPRYVDPGGPERARQKKKALEEAPEGAYPKRVKVKKKKKKKSPGQTRAPSTGYDVQEQEELLMPEVFGGRGSTQK